MTDLQDRAQQEWQRMTDALAMLEDVAARMEQERQDVLPKLRVATGGDAELLLRGLRMLESKLAEVRLKRNELENRRARFERVQAIATELARLRELRSLTSDEAVIADIRARTETLATELVDLKKRFSE